MTRRRTFITMCGAVLGSGCLGITKDDSTPTATDRPDSDLDGLPDSEDDYPDRYDLGKHLQTIEGRVTLAPGEYEPYFIDYDGVQKYIDYEFVVEGSSGIDALLMVQDEYEEYTERGNPKVRTTYTKVDATTGSVAFTLPEESSVFVLDYTEMGSEPGPNSVGVKLTLEIARVSPDYAEIGTGTEN